VAEFMIWLIFLGLLPSFIWLSFFLQEDIHPEPRKMVAYVFFGGIVAAVLVVVIQYLFESYLSGNSINKNGFYPVMVFAALEEIFKFMIVYLIISKSKYFDEPIDAMIYMVTAASGMAAIENVSVMMGGQIISEKVGILIFRFLGATLLHILSSSLVGYYWAKGIIAKRILLWLAVGLVLGSLLHAVFNYFVITLNGGIIYSIVFLVVAAFFIFYDFEKLKKSDKMQIVYKDESF
jgi:RsiW-degrading membrane proteinase PrsW (M82 family)